MIDIITKAKVAQSFSNRRDSLLLEGWRIVFERSDKFGAFCKMSHRNGSVIILTCDYENRQVRQKTDGVVAHSETVC